MAAKLVLCLIGEYQKHKDVSQGFFLIGKTNPQPTFLQKATCPQIW
jgi:hypothetical protein